MELIFIYSILIANYTNPAKASKLGHLKKETLWPDWEYYTGQLAPEAPDPS